MKQFNRKRLRPECRQLSCKKLAGLCNKGACPVTNGMCPFGNSILYVKTDCAEVQDLMWMAALSDWYVEEK